MICTDKDGVCWIKGRFWPVHGSQRWADRAMVGWCRYLSKANRPDHADSLDPDECAVRRSSILADSANSKKRRQHFRAVVGQDRFRMELQTENRQLPMPDAHDQAVRAGCGDLQAVRQAGRIDHQGMVAADVNLAWQSGKQRAGRIQADLRTVCREPAPALRRSGRRKTSASAWCPRQMPSIGSLVDETPG